MTIRAGRKRDQKDLLMRSLVTAIILYESVVTTAAKAKMIQGKLDRIILTAKSGSLSVRRRLLGYLLDKKAVAKVFDELVVRFGDRTSGFSRVQGLPPRQGDGATQAVVQLTQTVLVGKKPEEKTVPGDTQTTGAPHEGA